MAPPIYFFPAVRLSQILADGRLNRTFLETRGLERTFRDVADPRRDASLFELTAAGPGGASGTMLCALPVSGDAPPRLGYFPDQQQWTEFREFGQPEHAYWVAIDKEHPPTPDDLRRRVTFAGYDVELAGQQWHVPVIRNPNGGTGLPTTWKVAAGGVVQESIREEWRLLFESFGRAIFLFNDPDGPYPLEIDRAEALELCLDALAVNYRVGLAEQNLLGLIGSETWAVVLAVSVDFPVFADVYRDVETKKKQRLAAANASAAVAGRSPGS
jgi:hypothetical protein